jgi:hypothetical protein
VDAAPVVAAPERHGSAVDRAVGESQGEASGGPEGEDCGLAGIKRSR